MSTPQLVKLPGGEWIQPADVVMVDVERQFATSSLFQIVVTLRTLQSDGTPHGRPLKAYSDPLDCSRDDADRLRDQLAARINEAIGSA